MARNLNFSSYIWPCQLLSCSRGFYILSCNFPNLKHLYQVYKHLRLNCTTDIQMLSREVDLFSNYECRVTVSTFCGRFQEAPLAKKALNCYGNVYCGDIIIKYFTDFHEYFHGINPQVLRIQFSYLKINLGYWLSLLISYFIWPGFYAVLKIIFHFITVGGNPSTPRGNTIMHWGNSLPSAGCCRPL